MFLFLNDYFLTDQKMTEVNIFLLLHLKQYALNNVLGRALQNIKG